MIIISSAINPPLEPFSEIFHDILFATLSEVRIFIFTHFFSIDNAALFVDGYGFFLVDLSIQDKYKTLTR